MSSMAQHKLTNGNVGFVADAEQEHSAAPRAAAVDARHSSVRGSRSRSQRGEKEARQAVETPILTNPLEVRRNGTLRVGEPPELRLSAALRRRRGTAVRRAPRKERDLAACQFP